VGKTDTDARHIDAVEAARTSVKQLNLLEQLRVTRDASEVERLADELAAQVRRDGLPDAARIEMINVLVGRLTTEVIREDPDAEDAVCSALEQIGVMTRLDNRVFVFRPESELGINELSTVRQYLGWLPGRYAGPTRAR
jgi:hypothetical protein